MTTHWKTRLICECGHEGVHTHSENDQPFSKEWNAYRLEGFSGGGEYGWDETKMLCPQCSQTGKVKEVAKGT